MFAGGGNIIVPQWWSWLLTAVGVFGLWTAGSRKSWGWLVGLGAQVLWVAYALTTEQYGFLASAVAYGSVYARNFMRWRRYYGALRNLAVSEPAERQERAGV